MKKPRNVIYLNIAGFNIKIRLHPPISKNTRNLYINKLVKDICTNLAGFISKKTPKLIDYTVELYGRYFSIFKKRVNKEWRGFAYLYAEELNKTKTFQHISLPQFMFLLMNALQKLLASNKGFILHASAVNYKGKAVLFTGKSRAGKSTAMMLLNDKYPSLADDGVIIRRENSRFYLYQSPLIEKNAWVKRASGRYEIAKVFFLKKAKYFQIEKITNKTLITSYLSGQLRTDKENMKAQLKFFLEFLRNLEEFYFLKFAKNKDGMLDFFDKVMYIK